MSSALKKESGKVTVRTALDISSVLRTAIETSIKESFGSQPDVTFESAPDLICGIELCANGQKVAWSVVDYLSSIEESFEDLLKEKDK
jgi:F-type H+-transporting ATPase subunit b